MLGLRSRRDTTRGAVTERGTNRQVEVASGPLLWLRRQVVLGVGLVVDVEVLVEGGPARVLSDRGVWP